MIIINTVQILIKQLITKTALTLCLTIVFTSAIAELRIYVSPNGNDSNDGTFKNPLASLYAAIEKSKKHPDSCSIILKEGRYIIDKTIVLSNINNLSITGEGNCLVKLLGSINIPVTSIKKLSHSDSIKFNNDAFNRIFEVNMSELGILDYGQIRQVGYNQSVSSSWAEAVLNNDILHLSRWPNNYYQRIGEVIHPNDSLSLNKQADEGALFKYNNTRINSWKKEQDIWLYGYFKYGWAEDAVKVASIDTVNQTINTLHPSCHGFSSDGDYNRWYAFNVLKELDSEGEYYIDRKTGILYFFTKQKIESLELTQLKQPFITISNSSSISIQNIAFLNSRDRAVIVKNSDNIQFFNCQFKNLGSYAIHVDKGSSDCVIDNCLIKDVGVGGIILEGGNRKTLTKGNNIVTRSTITNFNRIDGAYRPAIRIDGVGNIVDQCEISQAPNMAIRIYGNDHKIINCHFFDICQTINDQGVIYTGRNPSERGHIIKGNIFRDITTSWDNTSVYIDDGACGMTIQNNIFFKPGRYAVLIGGGSAIAVKDNLFVDGNVAIHLDNRLETRSKKWLTPNGLFEKKLKAVRYTEEPYISSYPGIDKYFDYQGKPHNISITGNRFINLNHGFRGDSTLVSGIKNNITIANDTVNFKSLEQLYQSIDWPMIPLSEIGYQPDLEH